MSLPISVFKMVIIIGMLWSCLGDDRLASYLEIHTTRVLTRVKRLPSNMPHWTFCFKIVLMLYCNWSPQFLHDSYDGPLILRHLICFSQEAMCFWKAIICLYGSTLHLWSLINAQDESSHLVTSYWMNSKIFFEHGKWNGINQPLFCFQIYFLTFHNDYIFFLLCTALSSLRKTERGYRHSFYYVFLR